MVLKERKLCSLRKRLRVRCSWRLKWMNTCWLKNLLRNVVGGVKWSGVSIRNGGAEVGVPTKSFSFPR